MTKTISKIGNSQGIIFDAALMDLARVKLGDQAAGAVGTGIVRPGTPASRACSPWQVR